MVQLQGPKGGNSLDFTLPADAARRLGVKEGNPVLSTESPEGFLSQLARGLPHGCVRDAAVTGVASNGESTHGVILPWL